MKDIVDPAGGSGEDVADPQLDPHAPMELQAEILEPVEIVEVGPRDGLQNEARPIPLVDKIALLDTLGGAGFHRIEAGAFVNPARVPQMAETGAVFAGITRAAGVRYMALVPNLRGLADARAAGADEIAVFASAAEGFSHANLGMDIATSLEVFGTVAERAVTAGLPVRGYVSCVVECPYDGAVAPEAVARVSEALLAMGCYEISLGDTLGRAMPEAIDAMLAMVLEIAAPEHFAGHFHDTDGNAIANVDVALERGLRVFDGAIGGLGGCPFAPGAAGNAATEALHGHLTALGYDTSLDPEAISGASLLARRLVEHTQPRSPG